MSFDMVLRDLGSLSYRDLKRLLQFISSNGLEAEQITDKELQVVLKLALHIDKEYREDK